MRNISRRPQRQEAQIVSTPAPYKGLNDVDALSAMVPAYAIIPDNWLATPTPSFRPGSKKHATGFTDPVTSFLTYNARNSLDNKLFAVSADSIYDITDSGPIRPAV